MSVLIGMVYDDFGFLISDSRTTTDSGEITDESAQKIWELSDSTIMGCVGKTYLCHKLRLAANVFESDIYPRKPMFEDHAFALLHGCALIQNAEISIRGWGYVQSFLIGEADPDLSRYQEGKNRIGSQPLGRLRVLEIDSDKQCRRCFRIPKDPILPIQAIPPDVPTQVRTQEVQPKLDQLKKLSALADAKQALDIGLQVARIVADHSRVVNNRFQLLTIPREVRADYLRSTPELFEEDSFLQFL